MHNFDNGDLVVIIDKESRYYNMTAEVVEYLGSVGGRDLYMLRYIPSVGSNTKGHFDNTQFELWDGEYEDVVCP